MEGIDVRHVVDPETEFLTSKRTTGNECDRFKENVRPLKRGRKIEALNHAPKANAGSRLRMGLLEKRREMIRANDDYNGDDPLQPWIECIKWMQEAFPTSSGLVVLFEQCVRTFWHSKRYKNDLRYLKVWLEYAEHCNDAEVMCGFLDDNEIGKKHAVYYISYARHMESKDKIKAANEILNRGILSNAQPIKKLEDAFRKFMARSLRRPHVVGEEPDYSVPIRNFGTDLTMGGNEVRMSAQNYDQVMDKQKGKRVPLGIYKDKNTDISLSHQIDDGSKKGLGPWQNLGDRAERNNENHPLPAKWTSFMKPSTVAGVQEAVPRSTLIEVYVDEDCEETGRELPKLPKSELGHDEGDLRMKEELLKKNPLHNFPIKHLPR